MSIHFNSMTIVVGAVCAAFSVGVLSAKAIAFQSGFTEHMASGSLILAQASGEDPWAAVGDGAYMQDARGGGNPEDVEAKKQEAEQAVQEYLQEEY